MAKQRKAVHTKFKKEEKYIPRNKKEQQLINALTKINSEKDMSELLRDLMTLPEIEEFSNRLEMARLLSSGYSYMEVAVKMKVSTTTVSRVANWLYHGTGGYAKLFKKI
jgi:TrpR-related protein YerC/YecD